jgi:Ca2+/Na+ antiporter
MLLALTDRQEDLWWGAVIGGFVVIIAVVALLTLLVLFVKTIEERVTTIKATLEAAAANTSDTALIGETATSVEGVLNEGLNHHLFLGRVYEKVRS